jgi:hypothetical protein
MKTFSVGWGRGLDKLKARVRGLKTKGIAPIEDLNQDPEYRKVSRS